MANYKRKRSRTQRCARGSRQTTDFMKTWPRAWDVVFHVRPKRREESRLLADVVAGRLDPDGVAWPVASHKPHIYYW